MLCSPCRLCNYLALGTADLPLLNFFALADGAPVRVQSLSTFSKVSASAIVLSVPVQCFVSCKCHASLMQVSYISAPKQVQQRQVSSFQV